MKPKSLPEPAHKARRLDQFNNCGRTAIEYDARVFWQSRMTGPGQPAGLPELVDLQQLARDIRRAA